MGRPQGRSRDRREDGVTLIEVVVAMTVIMIVMGATAAFFISTSGITSHSFVRLDLLRQEVQVERRYQGEFTSKTGRVYRQTGVTEVPFLEKRGEPLALEVAHFLDCVRSREAPRVSGAQGLAALDLALRVRECCQTPAGSTAAAMPGASNRISSSNAGASAVETAARA